MKYLLSEECCDLLKSKNIKFKRAELSDIDKILDIYAERVLWFKQKEIKQWRNYLEHHPKSEFEDVIKNGYLFILKRDEKIMASFELSTDSKYWKDNKTESYYIYKLVTKVGNKEVGELIFNICRDLAKTNNKKYLRLDCLSTNKKLNEIYESYNFKLIKTGYEDYYPFALMEYEVNE